MSSDLCSRSLNPLGGLVALWALGAGCASFSSVQTASAVDAGKLRFSVGVEAEQDGVVGRSDTRSTWPQLQLGLRYGLGAGSDVGLRLWSAGGELSVKRELVRAGGEIFATGLAVSVQVVKTPGDELSIHFQPEVNLRLPLLYGHRAEGGGELVLGVTPSLSILQSEETATALLLTGTIGYAFHLRESFWVMPELSLTLPVQHWGIAGYAFSNSALTDLGILYLIQAGVAFHFGG